MPFRGLAMLKSTKLITKGGLCYGFAMVRVSLHLDLVISTWGCGCLPATILFIRCREKLNLKYKCNQCGNQCGSWPVLSLR